MKISILIPTGILLAVYWIKYFLTDYKKGMSLLIPLTFTCLFIPKLNLIAVNRTYSTAGIRADDLLTLALLAAALRDPGTWKNRHILRGIGFLTALSAVNLISMFIGRANGYENAVLFSILSIGRKYEYFAFALIGVYLSRKTGHAEKTALEQLTWMSVFHVIIGLLQIFRLCNVANSGSLTSREYDGFAVSTFNGNYEYGQFLCFAVAVYLCVFLRACKAGSSGKALFSGGMLLISGGMIWLTKSRSSLMIALFLMILILMLSVRTFSKRPVRIGAAVGILLFILAGVLFATGTLSIGRFEVVDLGKYAERLRSSIENGNLREYIEYVRSDIPEWKIVRKADMDISAALRFYKWGAALDGFRQQPVFGYGAGVTHVMDGNYIKLLGESGLAGALLWLAMYGYFMKTVRAVRKETSMAQSVLWMMVSVLIAALFIDMFEASKPMELLWLSAGLVIGTAARGPADTTADLE